MNHEEETRQMQEVKLTHNKTQLPKTEKGSENKERQRNSFSQTEREALKRRAKCLQFANK